MGKESATQYYNEALQQTNRKNWGKALEFLNKAIAQNSKHVKSYNILGMVYARNGDSNAARRYWLKALKIDAGNITAKQCLEGLEKRNISTRIGGSLRLVALAVVMVALIATYNFVWIRRASELRNEIKEIRAMAHGTRYPQSDLNNGQGGTGQSSSIEFANQDKVSLSIPPPEIVRAYTQAYNNCRSRKFDLAIKTFQQVLEYPSWHNLKDNAQYWLAECYYAKGEPIRALSEFQKVKEHFPKGNKVFDSELMIAYIWLRLGRSDQANGKALQLSRDFPDEEHKSSIATLFEKIRSS